MTEPRNERGMVTVELAVGILTASLMAIVACWVVMLVAVQAACGETASQMARQMARADTAGVAEARSRAPRDARITIDKGAREVRVVVVVQRSLGRIGPVTLRGEATAHREPGVAK